MEKIGQVNRYVCKDCQKNTVTINLNSGTTPFGIRCPKCGGHDCLSNFYKVGTSATPGRSIAVTVTEAFYRPTPEEYAGMDYDLQKFVHDGAMIHGPLGIVRPLPEGEVPATDFPSWQAFALKTYGPAPERK